MGSAHLPKSHAAFDGRSTGMRQRIAGLIVALFAATALAGLVGNRPTQAARDDLELAGMIYTANGMFLGDPANPDLGPLRSSLANSTRFTVWINHNGSWFSYASPTVPCNFPGLPISPGTCGGWYAINLNYTDKWIKWGPGDTYMIQVHAGSAGWGAPYTDHNFTSHGTGSFYDQNANFVQDGGEPDEYSGYGNLTNTIQWYPDDNWQQWDIGPRAVDYVPICTSRLPATVYGFDFDGACNPPSVSVALGSPHSLNFTVLNQGANLINLTSNAAAYDNSTPLTPLSPGLFGTPPLNGVGPGNISGPFSAAWIAPAAPGSPRVCVKADYDVPDDIDELNEANNEVCLNVGVALPDLVPEPVEVWVSGFLFNTYPWTITCPTIAFSLTDTLQFRATASNVANFGTGGTFTMRMYNTTVCQDAPSGTAFFTSGALGPLAGLGQTPQQNVNWPVPPSSGSSHVCIEVDPQPPLNGTVPEADNGNNILCFRLVYGGPDFIVDPVTVNGAPPVAVNVLTIGQPALVEVQTTNLGEDEAGTFPLALFESLATGARIGVANQVPIVGLLNLEAKPSLAHSQTFSWGAPGDYYVTACTDWVDPAPVPPNSGTISETDETNNCVTLHFQVQGPDLIPFNVLVDGSAPVACRPVNPGNVVTLSAQVRNQGANATASAFNFTFTNATAAGSPIPPSFIDANLPALAAGANSATQTALWDSTGLPNPLNYYINITADEDDDILEVSETNNTVIICLAVGGTADLQVESLSVQGAGATSPASTDAIAGQVVRLGAAVRNNGTVATSGFSTNFHLVFCQVSPFTAELARLDQGTRDPGEVRAPTVYAWRTPLVAGIYEVRIVADHSPADDCNQPVGVIGEPDDLNATNNNVFRVTVNVFELLPPPDPRVTSAGNDATLTWGSVASASEYEVYYGASPDLIDLTTPLATVPATGTLAYTHAGVLAGQDEAYYVIRSVDVRGWRGTSSPVVGVFSRTFPQGYTTFALPLLPFPGTTMTASYWTSQLLTNDKDTIYNFDRSRDNWIGHPKGLDAINPAIDNFAVRFGASYEVYRTAETTYRFTGYPATTVSFLSGDNGDARVGGDAAFANSLQVTASGGNLQFSWGAATAGNSTDEVLGLYRVFRSTNRWDFTAATEVQSTNATAWTTAMPACPAGTCEWYFQVAAENTGGRRGSTTFSAAVIQVNLETGYTTVGLPLEPDAARSAADLLVDFPARSVAFRQTPAGWSGHVKEMPATLDNFPITRGTGYTLYVPSATLMTWIGR